MKSRMPAYVILNRKVQDAATRQHSCKLPGWFKRHIDGLGVGAEIRCSTCERVWTFEMQTGALYPEMNWVSK